MASWFVCLMPDQGPEFEVWQPGVQMDAAGFIAGGNPAMD